MNLPDNFWQDLADHMLRGQKSVEEYERERFAVDHNPWENPKFTDNQLAEIFPEAKNILIKKYKDLIAQHKIQLDSLLEVNRMVRNKLAESIDRGHQDWYAGILEESELIKATMEQIDRKFKGIEICSVDYQVRSEHFFDYMKRSIAHILLNKNAGVTVIGPASVVKEIRKDPNKIELFTKDKKRKR